MSSFTNRIIRRLFPKKSIIRDYGDYCEIPIGRALLSYLVEPLSNRRKYRETIRFSNFGIARGICKALNEMGYLVDIIPYDNVGFTPSREYKIFIGHGGINFEKISGALSESTVQIYFSTGIYWREWNKREAYRIYEIASRKGFLLPPDRFIRYSEEFANENADGIICLGNISAAQTYSNRFPVVKHINNGVFSIVNNEVKDFELGRNHFLFFSGGGNIHKGLDLLIEAFVGTEFHLHVCQDIDPDFKEVYDHELKSSQNIHLYGFIPMREKIFRKLISKCNWVISATCAEGQPGAVLECMGYGLIPILPEASNIDLKDFGVPLANLEIETIRDTIIQVSKYPVQECINRSSKVKNEISKEYSPEKFVSSFKNAVNEIVKNSKK